MQFFASCPPGVADLTAAELRECGAARTREFKLGVQFDGELESAYRACLWSRTASRVLLPLGTFPAATAEALYEGVGSIDWGGHLDAAGSLAIEFGGASSGITHTHYGALKVKDAIVDQFRARTGQRPSIDLDRPDIRIDVRLDRERATVSLDLSGESLHRRGYRVRGVAAPLKENLAAAMLMRCGWPAMVALAASTAVPVGAEPGMQSGSAPLPLPDGGGSDLAFVDPLCGSGTLVIEAALIALDIAPGLLRRRFGFTGWRGHDRVLWQRLVEEARARRTAGRTHRIGLYGYDSDAGAVRAANENVERAGLRDVVRIERRELARLVRESGAAQGLLATNPPYGERIGEQAQLQPLYETLGRQLREHFEGWKAAVLTGNPPLAKAIGIEARRTHTLFNGRIECRLLRFDVLPAQYRSREKSATPLEEILARPGAQMFANRLSKNLKTMGDWARRESIDCFRIYDADMPEYAFAIDWYGDGEGNRWAVAQEYAPPRTVQPQAARQRRQEALAVISRVLDIPAERLFVRERRRQKDGAQYEKVAHEREFEIVREQPYRFAVNFSDYLDTGLFLDHRLTRRYLGALARGKRFLNLFAYTGAATVYAVGGGAVASTTVDMSHTYLDWARRNLALNGLTGPAHEFIQADCMAWLAQQSESSPWKRPRSTHTDPWARAQLRYGSQSGDESKFQERVQQWDLMFIDPPTHSRSKRMEGDFDVQRDHVELLRMAANLLAPDGVIVFSNNYSRFRLDAQALAGFDIEDIGPKTLPRDFARNPRIHSCHILRFHSVK
ncbi:23S rRNA (guanine2445-N2)-methyltransferase / 23S rRNA (guanine2069-N7)-methyltransferase [Steroidobacter denitrificans]|uniref:Ribosomal RNA large subunit methyltransferase K/L n=1 Tax=Steroidobacter denitrificans TaxID=465721 RepID=A0A127F8Y5_STEDE|nr:bifunctional 23S rRNA (guanine(2069)-N(7))-methyltransferase RlmK/23S rRNA (guanine(2445)-N(2))-methyltransferase RlmL [Steroidobacter denitrificans]AMN46068.1 23S rRNA (guanine2445-N2)-methyltransferase / 23S rRNA (guanine2069-N7)-methyltransferase [Steroidobacter denitrificans]